MLNELYRFELLLQDVEEPRIECESCGGIGVIDIGDCEDGVWDECPRCNGKGVEDDNETIFS